MVETCTCICIVLSHIVVQVPPPIVLHSDSEDDLKDTDKADKVVVISCVCRDCVNLLIALITGVGRMAQDS